MSFSGVFILGAFSFYAQNNYLPQEVFKLLRHCLNAARRREEIKECFTSVKQVFFSYTMEGSLMDTLVGPPV